MALNKSWVGFVIVNVCTYTIVIQFLRQLKTYLSHRDIRSIGTITELDNQEKIEP
jgi:hypothetical protein